MFKTFFPIGSVKSIVILVICIWVISCGGVSPPQGGSGELKINWKFPNNISCADAGVVVIGLEVYDKGGSLEYENNFSCDYMGVTITNFIPDTYDVVLMGYGTNGEIRYSGSSSVDVNGRVVLIELEYVLSDITFSWAFESPSNTDCVQAGVSKIGIKIINADGTIEFDEVVKCSDKGGTITAFAPKKRYLIQLTGYDVAGVALYFAEVEKTLNFGENNLGVIVLKRVYTKAIFSVGWTFAPDNKNCNEVGVVNVRLIFSAPSGGAVFLDKTISCVPQQYMNQDLSEGVYSFIMYGIDIGGNITYSSSQRNVELRKGNNDLGIIVLNKRE
ncbi:MAG: hypothetical protein N2746_10680 [Deltaproteobacteria bacterium]|nr:hypothetical protein [Deltaproteobacteria bacterium]